jgi:hypothetical protein
MRGVVLDLRSLALFRIAIAACLVTDLLLRIPEIDAFYTDSGVLPRSALLQLRDPFVCLHCISGEWLVEVAIFVVAIVCAIGLLVGYRTRFCTAASWALLMSMQARNPVAGHGGDAYLKMLLFWGIFVPLDGWWSVDRAGAPSPSRQHLSPGGVALICQIGAIYWFGFAEKLDPIWLTERSAVYYALNLDLFATPFGKLLLGHPEVLRALTAGTVLLELVGPLLAVSPVLTGPLRLGAILGFTVFHAGLGLTMRLGTFPWICVAAWLALLPSSFWDRLRLPHWHLPEQWRSRLGAWRRPPARGIGRVSGGVAIAALLLMSVSLVDPPTQPADRTVNGESGPLRLLRLVGLIQHWPMFAPHPTPTDGWYVMEGVEKSGAGVDPWTGRAPTDAKPRDFRSVYPDTRWLGYLFWLQNRSAEPYRPYFGRYLCRSWNERHVDRMDSVAVFYMREQTPPPGEPATPPTKELLLSQRCDAT